MNKFNLKSLKTLKGSRIGYSSYGLGGGKRVGSKIYIHKDYALRVIPQDIYLDALNLLRQLTYPEVPEFNCVCWDVENPVVVRFDTCPGFDTQREPVVGWQYKVDTNVDTLSKSYCPQIFHHKWLWCASDYNGFDILESYNWSKTWLSKLDEVASGYPDKWKEQLRKVGLD